MNKNAALRLYKTLTDSAAWANSLRKKQGKRPLPLSEMPLAQKSCPYPEMPVFQMIEENLFFLRDKNSLIFSTDARGIEGTHHPPPCVDQFITWFAAGHYPDLDVDHVPPIFFNGPYQSITGDVSGNAFTDAPRRWVFFKLEDAVRIYPRTVFDTLFKPQKKS